jgi:protein gp37
MADQTNIKWCEHTFNPWRGCAKVSPGCTHCYAETITRRSPGVLGEWAPSGRRVIAAETYWRLPLKWDRAAERAAERRRVFCANLADVFEDRPGPREPRARLLHLIRRTRNLDWLMLTKRPEAVNRLVPADTNWEARHWFANCPDAWVGASEEDRQRADERIPLLREVPAAVPFLSVEPHLEPVELGLEGIHWVIVGGEIGPEARPCHAAWVLSVLRQCERAGVACFVKQMGLNVWDNGERRELKHKKGGDLAEWPEAFQVREFPESPAGCPPLER